MPFLIAFVIVMFLLQSFLTLSQSLVYVSVAQYMSYSSARKLSLDHGETKLSASQARDKWASLKSRFFKGGTWFELSKPSLGFHQERGYDINSASAPWKRDLFYGFYATFLSRVLNFQIPFLVKTADKKTLTGKCCKLFRQGTFSRRVSKIFCRTSKKYL